MSADLALALSLAGLAATLAVAVAQPRWLSEAVAGSVAAALLVAVGAVSIHRALHAVAGLVSTIGFLTALLLLADGCRREGLFEALGTIISRRSRGSPRRLLALVFAAAAGVTVTLGLDPTIVLLTPVVLVTAVRLRLSSKPYEYACAHLANSASLLLPISNLTNLLAFHASGLSFMHFATLMALPTAGAIAVEWVVLTRFFAPELRSPPDHQETQATPAPARLPRFALGVLGATLAGFLLSSLLKVEPVFIAAAGAAAITLPALVRKIVTPRVLIRTVQPSFLVFVLGLGVVVEAASSNGLATAVHSILPAGGSLPDLLCITAVSAVLANLVNNLPAILILAPIAAAAGPGAVLAALVGVNVGPNLTYAGSLATLLWRRILRASDIKIHLGEFFRLGAITVPAALLTSTLLLWLALKAAP
jgi:arsenical pump membrane protein